MELPDHQSDYCPHIIGDLRSGGFTVDILAHAPSKQGIVISLFITW